MKKSTAIKVIANVSLILLLLFVAVPVLAETLDLGVDVVGGATGLGKKDLRETIGALIKVALGFIGVVALVIVLIGGFKYMTAGGEEKKTEDAKKWIYSGIIGLAIVLSAYAITSFVIERLLSATTGGANVVE